MKEKIYLVDGSSFLYRFYYAIKNLSHNGFPTSVIFGFSRLLLSLKDEKFILICFDSKEKTFRKALFDDYKKQRPKMPEELSVQINPTKEIINAFGINYLEIPGFEADDIIATLTIKFKKDYEIVIVTQDKDLFQLVEDNVYIFDPVKNATYDYKKTVEKFGVLPNQISDLLALIGDASDGIPGINGIGPKTAAKLLHDYTNIEGIIQNKNKLPDKLKKHLDEETLKLYKSLTTLDKNIDEFLLFEVELPLANILKKMEQEGIGIDIEKLKRYKTLINDLIEEKRSSIEKFIGPCNINSTKELQVALYEKLAIKPIKKTKTGYSTDSFVLEQIDHPVAKLIIDYRMLTKLLSTYIEPLLNNADKNNRVHTTFNQTLTLTGRLSSSNPNMQNLPLDSPFFNIRETIVSKSGYSLICADYSQIELRILAELSKDPNLIDIFKKDLDIHSQTACEVLNILPEMVDTHARRIAKTINFGIIYGMGEKSLAKTLSITPQKASEYIARYFERFSKAKEFIEETLKEAKNLGYTQTYFNRRRYFENINSPNKKLAEFEKRAAVNAKIQGTAADIIKIAMVKLDKALENFDAKMILQIHDELLIECKDNQIDKIKLIVKEIMEQCVNFEVPLKVNIGIGKNWHEAKT